MTRSSTRPIGRAQRVSSQRPVRHAPGWSLPSLVGQIVLVALAALAYFGVRGLTQGGVAAAVDHAGDVMAVEEAIGMAWENRLQDVILDNGWLTAAANWVYIYGHWPVVIGVLVWLLARHRDRYLILRDAMFISGAIGLVVFMAFPTAPPRLVDLGLIDTVTEQSSSYRALQPPGLLNKYAAMPSLHFGWNLLVGIVMYQVARSMVLKAVAVALPIAMALAVIMTANHYVLDVIAGGIVALAGLALVRPVQGALRSAWIRQRSWMRGARAPSRVGAGEHPQDDPLGLTPNAHGDGDPGASAPQDAVDQGPVRHRVTS